MHDSVIVSGYTSRRQFRDQAIYLLRLLPHDHPTSLDT